MEYSNQSIRTKIIGAILMTSTAVLLLTGIAYLTYEFFAYRKNAENKISVIGAVISNNSTAALSFDDKDDAYEILSALKVEENMVVAALYDNKGNLFAKYPKEVSAELMLSKTSKKGYIFSGSYLEGFEPVILGSKQIGTLYLKYDLKAIKDQYMYYIWIAFAIFILSLLIAYILSSQLQKKISKPIIALANFAYSISVNKDYSVRTQKQSDDEIGQLTDAFNQMLTQIDNQSIALQESENNFRTLADNIPNLCWMANPEGEIFWYNKRWYDYTGIPVGKIEGIDWESVYDIKTMPHLLEIWKESIQKGELFEMIISLKGKDNTCHPFLTRVSPLQNEKGEIFRWFGTSTDITKQINAEETLEKKNKELSKINNDLDNFIYTASHDLKSPISNLEGLLSMVSDKDEGMITEQGRSILPLVNQSLNKLKIVIEDLADIARIQKDTEAAKELITLEELFQETLVSCKKELTNYNGKVKSDFSKGSQVKFSKTNLRSVFYNLISNALKYSDKTKEGLILISSEKQIDSLVLTISDNGLGIPEAQLNKVFGMFKRYHTHVEGTGVGLYIVKRIIENAGGKIEIESKEGVGTTFKIYFVNDLV